jgi:small subunit ribosomal protein S9
MEGSKIIAVGRRKTSTARVRLAPGTGIYQVNGRSLAEYFPVFALQQRVLEPLKSLEMGDKFDCIVSVSGGGVASQADAVRLGIARHLVKVDPELRTKLKGLGFLTRDPRAKERKKYGRKRARKQFQFSKR